MNNGEEITNLRDLKRYIRALESECKEKEHVLKSQAMELMENIKPSVLVKKAISKSIPIALPLLQKGLAGKAIGFVTRKIAGLFRKNKRSFA